MGHARLVKAALLSMPGDLAVDSGLEDSRLGIGEALDSAPFRGSRSPDGRHPPGARGPWRVATGAWLEGHATRIVR